MGDALKVLCQNPDKPHYFDGNLFKVCPYCGAPIAGKANEKGEIVMSKSVSADADDKSKKSEKKGWFGVREKHKAEKKDSIFSSEGFWYSSSMLSGNPSVKTPDSESVKKEQEQEKKDLTYPLKDVEKKGDHKKITNSSVEMEYIMEDEAAEEYDEEFSESKDSVENREQEPKKKAPKRITDLDEVTTRSVFANSDGEEPVTGWLVCVQGDYRGTSFPLKAGKNAIGRDGSAYVCLKKDGEVSRKHAVIIYEPKKREFFLKEEDGLVYCNDELIAGRQALNDRDVVEMGTGKYLFVALCGEQFDWTTQE